MIKGKVICLTKRKAMSDKAVRLGPRRFWSVEEIGGSAEAYRERGDVEGGECEERDTVRYSIGLRWNAGRWRIR